MLFDRIPKNLLLASVVSAISAFCFAPNAIAQQIQPSPAETKIMTPDVESLEEVDVSRPIDELPDDVEPDDPDTVDTALVFTNQTNRHARVKCVAFDKNGEPVGRSRSAIPPRGVRYVLVSDMSAGADFIGQVQCAPYGKLIGSVVFLGPDITDLPVRNGRLGKSRIRFPLVAHY